MPTSIPLPNREGGTLAVLNVIAQLGQQGLRGGWIMPSADIDAFLRANWNYVFRPLPDIQELKTPDLMVSERLADQHWQFTGACADAAALALALLAPGSAATICALRSPGMIGFDHVLVLLQDLRTGETIARIDPTAPVDADYTHWEPMGIPFRKG